MNVLETYNKAKKDLFDHIGFTPDWVVCPIDDRTEYYWQVDFKENEYVRYAESIEILKEEDYYEDEIYTQRFYKKWVYRGEKFTMIFCDPHVDGVKWSRIFSNDKEIK